MLGNFHVTLFFEFLAARRGFLRIFFPGFLFASNELSEVRLLWLIAERDDRRELRDNKLTLGDGLRG